MQCKTIKQLSTFLSVFCFLCSAASFGLFGLSLAQMQKSTTDSGQELPPWKKPSTKPANILQGSKQNTNYYAGGAKND